MIKRLIGALVLLGLFGLVVYNFLTEQNDQNLTNGQQGDGLYVIPEDMQDELPEGIKTGDAAPDFTLESLAGEEVSLSDFRGKKVFLNFWASWCPPCRAEMPEMQEFHEKYGDEVVIIAVNATGTERSLDVVKEYVEKNNYTFTILLDKDLKVNATYQALSLPTTYYINSEGIIQFPRKIGPMDFDMMKNYMEELN
ncbi:MAG: TlpA family protein disulfide reductase [Bacillaceae bacterium]|nr:TlpA family protein disulfide reductase [Bacillaceae bacterium]